MQATELAIAFPLPEDLQALPSARVCARHFALMYKLSFGPKFEICLLNYAEMQWISIVSPLKTC